jgi:hypothetical protein
MGQLIVIQWYMVIVEMPKETREQGFSVWGTVGIVQATGEEEAIEKAIKGTGGRIFDVVPSGEMKFVAIPTKEAPTRKVFVTSKDREFQSA